MKMHETTHPHDERLAALAGDDPEVVADRPLREHVAGCARCGALVGELRSLRADLARLPDLAPPRTIQLVPPVPAGAGGGSGGWLRRLVAPLMVAGAGMALVGVVGLGGVLAGSMASGGAAVPETAVDRADTSAAPAEGGAPGAASMTPQHFDGGTAEDSDEDLANDPFVALTDPATPTPWLALVLGGSALLLGALVLRHAIRPRAG